MCAYRGMPQGARCACIWFTPATGAGAVGGFRESETAFFPMFLCWNRVVKYTLYPLWGYPTGGRPGGYKRATKLCTPSFKCVFNFPRGLGAKNHLKPVQIVALKP